MEFRELWYTVWYTSTDGGDMAHPRKQLDDKTVRNLTSAGSFADGNGLYLKVKPSGGKSWVFRYMFDGKRRNMGLGGYPDIELSQARERLAHWRRVLNGSIETSTPPRDPLELKSEIEANHQRAERRLVTFDEIAAKFIAANRPSWSNPKHAKQWESTLATYASPAIGGLLLLPV